MKPTFYLLNGRPMWEAVDRHWSIRLLGPGHGLEPQSWVCTFVVADGDGGFATEETPDAAIKAAIVDNGWDVPSDAVCAIVAITAAAMRDEQRFHAAMTKAVSEQTASMKGAIERMAKRPGPKPPQHNLLVKPRIEGACARCGSQVPHPIYAFCTACRKATGKA